MVAQMHPRSRTTMGLFGTTLAVSFLVVGLPHILPCPVPRTSFAESQIEITEDGRRRRRRRVPRREEQQEEASNTMEGRDGEDQAMVGKLADSTAASADPMMTDKVQARECPVPKPKGILGQILGFTAQEGGKAERVEVKVEERK